MVPSFLDDDKMNIDDEAVVKLLDRFYEEQKIQQVMKCETEPQMMTPVTGELLQLPVNCLFD